MRYMGTKRLDKISDYARHGFNLQAVCRRCGHTSVLDSRAVSTDCIKKRLSRDMEAVRRRLRCGDCGHRDIFCGPTERLA